jgi:VWFA-related protein
VFEDGTRQKILSTRLVTTTGEREIGPRSEPNSQAGQQPTTAASPSSQLKLVTLVFDRISPYGRKMARDAAREYFKNLGSSEFVGVMAIDRSLRILQPFTTDVRLLEKAVGLAADGTPQQFADASSAVQEAIQRSQEATSAVEALTSGASQAGGPGAGVGDQAAQAKLNEMVGNMFRLNSVADESIQGRATVESLINIVRAEQVNPGRKAVVFFAERIALPTQVVARFKDLISAANRANVSFYCVDASGLKSTGDLVSMSKELGSLSNVSRGQQARRGGAVTREEVTLTENTENAMRMSAQNSLADLAASTGGILITNTNDLGAGLQHVSDDLNTHYELSYVPSNTNYDGTFRKLEVKVKRSGLVTRSRSGYYAIRSDDVAVSSFEVSLLTALGSKVLPKDLTFHSTSLLYPTRGAKTETLLYLEIPLADFSFPIDTKSHEYQARVSALVVVKNAEGKIEEKFSQEFPLHGQKDKVAETKTRNLVFYRTTQLVPGKHTVEAVVKDGVSEKIAVKRSVVMVPARSSPSLALSSIVVVKRLDPSHGDTNLTESPLMFKDQMIVPNLNPEVNAKDWPQLGFYFVVIQGDDSGVGSMVDMIISKDGKPIARMGEQALPPPDDRGRIPYLASLPLGSLSSGNYDVNVVVRRGAAAVSSTALFIVQ